MWRLHNFRRLPWRARLYLMEALALLVAARLALRLIPFARLAWFLERAPRQPEVRGAARAEMRRGVQWAIDRASLYLPGETVCFPRAMAAQAMLRRRGVGTTLYFGAANEPTHGLQAHVWLQDGAEGVVGHHNAQQYHILARYPQS